MCAAQDNVRKDQGFSDWDPKKGGKVTKVTDQDGNEFRVIDFVPKGTVIEELPVLDSIVATGELFDCTQYSFGDEGDERLGDRSQDW